MKKIILIITLILSTLSFSEEINVQNIAVVDVDMVLEQYNKRMQFEESLAQKRKEYDKTLASYKESILEMELEFVRRDEGPSNEEIRELNTLKKELEETFNDFDSKLNKQYNDYMYQLNSDVATAAVVVGRENGFDIVFHMGTTFYGGTDITRDIIDFLNKGEEVSLFEEDMNTINNDLHKYKN